MPYRFKRFYLLAAVVWLSAAPAFGQQFLELPPNSVVGNLIGQSNPSNAVDLPHLAAALMLTANGGLVQGPTTATPGHAVVFGANGSVIADGGGLAGSGTVSSVTCGGGLSGGTITTVGTCALVTPITPGTWVGTITPQLRLTLATGTPVMTSTVSGATSVIVTPYSGCLFPLFDGANMVPTCFSEVSQATSDATKSPAAVAASKVYDIFCWVNSSTNRCTRGPAWTNSTTRGYTLTMTNGILLNTSSITNGPAALRGTWVGTIASNASSTIDYILGGSASGGTAAVLNVWNAYNRRRVGPQVTDNGTNYTYSSSTIRQARASAGNQISYVVGAAEDAITVSYTSQCSTVATIAASCQFGIGLDATNAFAISPFLGFQNNSSTASEVGGSISYQFMTSLGSHVIFANEASDGSHSNTFNVGSFGGTLTAGIWM